MLCGNLRLRLDLINWSTLQRFSTMELWRAATEDVMDIPGQDWEATGDSITPELYFW